LFDFAGKHWNNFSGARATVPSPSKSATATQNSLCVIFLNILLFFSFLFERGSHMSVLKSSCIIIIGWIIINQICI
jgi:hypothetical protein